MRVVELACDAIIFDLDGVLIDSSTVVERHWRRWAERHGIEYARISAVMHGRRSAETVAIVAPHLEADREAREMEAGEAIDTSGLRVLDGASVLLNSLPAERWGIATSGTLITATTRLRFGGLPIPSALVTADDVRRGKPHPDAFLLVSERLGVAPPACVVVEDAPAGLAAAHAAGMRTIAVLTTHTAAALTTAALIVPRIASLDVRQRRDWLAITAPSA